MSVFDEIAISLHHGLDPPLEPLAGPHHGVSIETVPSPPLSSASWSRYCCEESCLSMTQKCPTQNNPGGCNQGS